MSKKDDLQRDLNKLIAKYGTATVATKLVEEESFSPVIYRYVRPCDWDGAVHNLGGMTLAFQINYTDNTVACGVSMCRDDENFEKYLGRVQAKDRLEGKQYTFKYDVVDGGLTLCQGLSHALSHADKILDRFDKAVYVYLAHNL